jgi:hypothetical protein
MLSDLKKLPSRPSMISLHDPQIASRQSRHRTLVSSWETESHRTTGLGSLSSTASNLLNRKASAVHSQLIRLSFRSASKLTRMESDAFSLSYAAAYAVRLRVAIIGAADSGRTL